jgi:adenine-specific DNA-methyltransferase
MANITKQKRDQMIAFLEKLKKEHSDDVSVRAFNEIENHLTEKNSVWFSRNIQNT